MKYSDEKKQTILLYILEKIEAGAPQLSKTVAETFSISTNTVHTYLNELLAEGIITKPKRGSYALVTNRWEYTFSRSRGELVSDTLPYDKCLSAQVAHLPMGIRHIWEYALSEMVNNVIDHSGAESLHIEIEQSYLRTAVALTDNGVGIFEKIQKHFSLPSLDEAICELFKGKLTTDAANHSGEGIFFTSRMMDSFMILSSGRVFSTTKYSNDSVRNAEVAPSGTCVLMSLSNFTNKQIQEIFNSYFNGDGAFTTTRIPLKNVFDSAPVSRSQAKRICNRLESFEEVILDFDGVIWMGQGFAHQIFAVFSHSHPDVSILPVNMNADVESMYRHVTGTH